MKLALEEAKNRQSVWPNIDDFPVQVSIKSVLNVAFGVFEVPDIIELEK
jgi:hypothetical protein